MGVLVFRSRILRALAAASLLAAGTAAEAASVQFFANDYTYYQGSSILYQTSSSGWGSVDLTYDGASQIQYFNLLVNGDWKVTNMTLGAFAGVGNSTAVTFNFGLPSTVGSSLSYSYAITSTPYTGGLFTPDASGTNIVAQRDIVGGNAEDGDPWIVGAPLAAYDGGPGPAAKQDIHANFPNQDCRLNFCVPVSISNSLQWLNSTYNLNMPADKISTEALAAALGTTEAGGTPNNPKTWWDKKDQYLKDNKLPVTQTVSTKIEDAVAALAKDDIEMRAPGHAAAVVSLSKLANGKYEVTVAHDTEQGKDGKGTKLEKGTIDPDTLIISGITFMDGKKLDRFVIEAAAVPEPATWAMMIVGVGFVGGTLRRQRRVSLVRVAVA